MTMRDMLSLDGQVALVTGAGSGIGLAIAQAFAECGADVACVDLDEERAAPGVAAVQAAGRRAIAIGANVARSAEVAAAVNRTEQELGPLTTAVANAGIGGTNGPLTEMTDAAWQEVIDVNLSGVFYTFREAARVMLPRGTGSMIATCSIYGYGADFGFGAFGYTAAKGGVLNLTRTTAVQLAKSGIRVNGIAPAFVRTNIAGGLLSHPTPEVQPLIDEIIHRTPLGRMAAPVEMAGACVFLASPAASYVTGVTLPVDGGWTAW